MQPHGRHFQVNRSAVQVALTGWPLSQAVFHFYADALPILAASATLPEMDFVKAIYQCLTAQDDDAHPFQVVDDTEKSVSRSTSASLEPTEDDVASSILTILFTAEKPGQDLERRLRAEVSTTGWYEGLAKRLLDGLVAALESGRPMAGAMQEAYNKASGIALEFAREHPVLTVAITTIIAIGLLAILLPWAVEALGFGESGPVEGSFAAWWQSTFPNVPAESFFAWFQRLGMRWGKK